MGMLVNDRHVKCPTVLRHISGSFANLTCNAFMEVCGTIPVTDPRRKHRVHIPLHCWGWYLCRANAKSYQSSKPTCNSLLWSIVQPPSRRPPLYQRNSITSSLKNIANMSQHLLSHLRHIVVKVSRVFQGIKHGQAPCDVVRQLLGQEVICHCMSPPAQKHSFMISMASLTLKPTKGKQKNTCH